MVACDKSFVTPFGTSLIASLDVSTGDALAVLRQFNTMLEKFVNDPPLITETVLFASAPSLSDTRLYRGLKLFIDLWHDSDNNDSELWNDFAKLPLNGVWQQLGKCMDLIRQAQSLHRVTDVIQYHGIVLPWVEAFVTVAAELSGLQEKKQNNSGVSTQAHALQQNLQTFAEEHKVFLNEIVRNNPKLIEGPLKPLLHTVKILDMETKLHYFRKELAKLRLNHRIQVHVRRAEVCSRYKQLYDV